LDANLETSTIRRRRLAKPARSQGAEAAWTAPIIAKLASTANIMTFLKRNVCLAIALAVSAVGPMIPIV